MPPPMPNPAKRMTAQPSRPVQRYRPGKAVAEVESSDEDEVSEEEQTQRRPQKRQPARPQVSKAQARAAADDEDDEEGFVTDPDDEEEEEEETNLAGAAAWVPAGASIVPSAPAREQLSLARSDEEEVAEQECGSGSETEESDSEEDSSSDEEPRRKFQRPTFIKKSDRQQFATKDPTATPAPLARESGQSPSDDVDDQARRLAQTELLIKDKLERDALARSQGRRAWDDDDDVDPEALVDDTDGLDPKAEHAAWRLRELQRLKRDREALVEHEKEIEELERRRNLTAEEREKEDKEYVSKQKEEHEDGRGQAGFLSRYHHKGAFFQDDEVAQVLAKRDLMGAQFQDDVRDKNALPEYMRIRDMTKLGKKGRTRYKDLRNEDTGMFGDETRRYKGVGGDNPRGIDDRFIPDDDRRGPQVSGANDAPLGQRRPRRSRSRSPRRQNDDRGGDTYRPQRRSYSRSESRSRSPHRRKRSPSLSRSQDRYKDKRRRVDVA